MKPVPGILKGQTVAVMNNDLGSQGRLHSHENQYDSQCPLIFRSFPKRRYRRLMGSPSGRRLHPTTLFESCASQQNWLPMPESGSTAAVISALALGLLYLSQPTLLVRIGTAGSCQKRHAPVVRRMDAEPPERRTAPATLGEPAGVQESAFADVAPI